MKCISQGTIGYGADFVNLQTWAVLFASHFVDALMPL